MRWQPLSVVGGSYSDDALPWSHQDTVNYLPVPAEKSGTRSSAILRCLPGFSTFCNLGTNAPIRGARNVEGLLVVVSGKTLFKVSPTGVATSIGTIPGVQRCSLTHNQIAGGNQVAISNGQSGYVYNTVTGTLAQITDEGFLGAISFDEVDGYILGIDPSRRRAFTSDLADATSYNTLDQNEAEGSPDLLRGQAVTHREWWLMGERTIEPFTNTGAGTGTFQRSQGTVIEVGLAATHALAVMDNSVFWLGNDGIVYRANGYTPQRISTHAIEQAIARCNMIQAFAFTYEDRGHKIFYLTFPDGHTWGYDAATGEWHRRASYGINRWRINTMTRWNGKWIAGDYANGKLYLLDWDVQHEDGAPLERRRITGVTSDSQNAMIINGIELVFDAGLPGLPVLSLSGQLPNGTVGGVVNFRYMVDGGIPPIASFTITSGSLPSGLSMSTSGVVTGTLGAAGTYSWTISVSDELGNSAILPDSSVVFDTINSAIADDAPLLHWPLSETSGTVANDLSGNGYNGTYSGGSLTGSGFKMTAYTDYVIAATGSAGGSPLDVGAARQWAAEAVVTRGATQPFNDVDANIAAQWRSYNLGYVSFGLSMPSTGMTATGYSGRFTTSNLSGSVGFTSASPPIIGQRTHVCVERVQGAGSMDTMNIYLNGVLSATIPVVSTLIGTASNGQQFTVGNTPISGYGWLGTVEHVAVYNHALGASRALYHAQLLGLA